MSNLKDLEKRIKEAKTDKERLEIATEGMGDYEKVLFFKELSRLAKEQPEIQKKLEEKGIRV